MEKRVTIYDIARELQISTATVNRALTGKDRVSEKTRERVFEAAQRMGFKPNQLARSLARRPVRIAVVAFTSFPEFHGEFLKGVAESSEELRDFNVAVDCFAYDRGSSDSAEGDAYLEDTLALIAQKRYDGALVCARDARNFDLLRDRGVCTATAVTDVNPLYRRFCIQYNGFVAGKLAAEIIYRVGDRSRPVAIASGRQTDVSIHREIVDGFREQLAQTPLKLATIYYHRDDEELAYSETLRVLSQYPDLGAIYVNSFNSRNVLRAVCERGLAGRLTIVTSDVYQELRGFIQNGTVVATIFQNQYQQGRQGLRLLYQTIAEGLDVPSTVTIAPEVAFASNLELF